MQHFAGDAVASGGLAGYRLDRVLRVRYSDLDAVLPRVPCVPDV